MRAGLLDGAGAGAPSVLGVPRQFLVDQRLEAPVAPRGTERNSIGDAVHLVALRIRVPQVALARSRPQELPQLITSGPGIALALDLGSVGGLLDSDHHLPGLRNPALPGPHSCALSLPAVMGIHVRNVPEESDAFVLVHQRKQCAEAPCTEVHPEVLSCFQVKLGRHVPSCDKPVLALGLLDRAAQRALGTVLECIQHRLVGALDVLDFVTRLLGEALTVVDTWRRRCRRRSR